MSGNRPRWRMFLMTLYPGQTNSDASEMTANIWLRIFNFGFRKSARNHKMLNVTTHRYTQLAMA
jgi:hypothetical protein